VSFSQKPSHGKEEFGLKKKRFSVEQMVAVLKHVELGKLVADVIRRIGISEQMACHWKKQHAALQPDQIRERKQLPDEKARLKRVVADRHWTERFCRTSFQKRCGAPRAETMRRGQPGLPPRRWFAAGILL